MTKPSKPCIALAVQELEPGEFHWMLLEEASGDGDELLSFVPCKISDSYPNSAAAWVAGYLALRATSYRAEVGR